MVEVPQPGDEGHSDNKKTCDAPESNDSNDPKRKDLLEDSSKKSEPESHSGFDLGSWRRRSLVKSVAAGIGLVSFLPGITAGGDDTVEIIKAHRGPDDKVYHEVPEQWHEHFLAADEVFDDLKDRYMDDADIAGIGMGSGDERLLKTDDFCLNEYEFRISSEDVDYTRDRLPDQRDGFNIVVERHVPAHLTDWCDGQSEDDTYECVPGGAVVDSATGGCIVNQVGNSIARYITAAHVIRETGSGTCEDIVGESVDHQGRRIGEVFEVSDEHDTAIITDDTDNSNTLDGIDDKVLASLYDVEGFVDRDTVCLHAAESDECPSNTTYAHKYGKTTGWSTGRVLEIECTTTSDNDCEDDVEAVEWIWTEAKTWTGDSGGPTWYEDGDEEESYMYGINHAIRRCCEDEEDPNCDHECECDDWEKTKHTAAYGLNNDYNLYFDYGSTC